ncbi:MAG: histidinol-phosphatase HisJ family protein [Solirubrobacteraceae bacterium]|nr:MAG: histidinol phosphate phosphatase [Solirubrobacterales bacterium]
MLTDYHVHLRPDDPDTPAQRYFTAANAERFRTVAEERGIAELGVSEHIHRFRSALDIWTHPFWREQAVDDLEAYCEYVREETDLKLGIEADFIPGREDRLANLLDAHPFDYVIGSVHFLGDDAVDHADYDIWERAGDPDRVWRRYFNTLSQAALSGLFDILAHPDLVKRWGHGRPRPDGDLRRFYEPAVEAIVEAGVAVEVSTAGLRKPVGELYPAPAFLELCVEGATPIALSSDAHVPADVGSGYDHALAELERVGVNELCVFERRSRQLEPLG